MNPLSRWYELCKPGIAGYVMITVGVAAYVASRGQVELALAVHAMLGTAVGTAGSLALNQYAEREPDAIMLRTHDRPIPSGRVEPRHARWVDSNAAVRRLCGRLPLGLPAAQVPVAAGHAGRRRTRRDACSDRLDRRDW